MRFLIVKAVFAMLIMVYCVFPETASGQHSISLLRSNDVLEFFIVSPQVSVCFIATVRPLRPAEIDALLVCALVYLPSSPAQDSYQDVCVYMQAERGREQKVTSALARSTPASADPVGPRC
jgi:hypothetical protein